MAYRRSRSGKRMKNQRFQRWAVVKRCARRLFHEPLEDRRMLAVLMVDADVYVAEDCIELLLAAWEEDRPTVVCPRIRLFPEKHQVQCDGAAPHFVGTMTLRHAYQPFEDLDRERAEVGGAIEAAYARRLVVALFGGILGRAIGLGQHLTHRFGCAGFHAGLINRSRKNIGRTHGKSRGG